MAGAAERIGSACFRIGQSCPGLQICIRKCMQFCPVSAGTVDASNSCEKTGYRSFAGGCNEATGVLEEHGCGRRCGLGRALVLSENSIRARVGMIKTGYPRPADLSWIAMAKWHCRTSDRNTAPRVPRPYGYLRRGAPTTNSFRLCRVLQSLSHTPGITEKCALASSGPAIWRHCRHSDLGWATSSIRPDMIFGKDTGKNTDFIVLTR